MFTGLAAFTVLMIRFRHQKPSLQDNPAMGISQQYLLVCREVENESTAQFLSNLFVFILCVTKTKRTLLPPPPCLFNGRSLSTGSGYTVH